MTLISAALFLYALFVIPFEKKYSDGEKLLLMFILVCASLIVDRAS